MGLLGIRRECEVRNGLVRDGGNMYRSRLLYSGENFLNELVFCVLSCRNRLAPFRSIRTAGTADFATRYSIGPSCRHGFCNIVFCRVTCVCVFFFLTLGKNTSMTWPNDQDDNVTCIIPSEIHALIYSPYCWISWARDP